MRDSRVRLWFILVASAVVTLSCTSDTKSRGQLIVAISTDLSITKDMDDVLVDVLRSDGTALPERRIPILPSEPAPFGKPLPGTIALLPSDAGGEQVLIRLVARHHHPDDTSVVDSRIVREAIVKVPTDRVALLEMPLQWLCDGQVSPGKDGATPTSSCYATDRHRTCGGGACISADVDTNALPDYKAASVFGGGDEHGKGSACLDVQRCFSGTTAQALPASGACEVPLPDDADPASLNVAMVLPSNSDGHCVDDPEKGKGQGPCYLPLDNDPVEGFRVDQSRIVLPGSVCRRQNIRGISVSTSCRTKDLSIPVCGPWTGWANNDDGAGGTEGLDASDGSGRAGGGRASGAGGASGGRDGVAGMGVAPLESGGATNTGGAGGTGDGGFSDTGGTIGAGGAPLSSGGGPTRDAASCVASGTGAVAVEGCPCTPEGALSCAGNAQRQQLTCMNGEWKAGTPCAPDQRCDTASGADQGKCVALDPPCSNARPGDEVCGSATTVVRCGDDLVSDTPVETCKNQACVGATCVGSCTPGTACGASCTNGTATAAGTCDDTGTCHPGSKSACAPYLCGPTACATSCKADSDCIAGDFCWLSACVNVTEIAASGSHTCALTSAGSVQCWGWNIDGELGNGSKTQSPVPVPVSGLSSGIVSIGMGDYHTCAISKTGGVSCWGDNSYGQLGNNSKTESSVPVPVSGLSSGVAAITGGYDGTCALTTAGGVSCWGDNSRGQLGNNSTTSSLTPVAVSGFNAGVAAIADGCAVTKAGAALCWGANSYGQLGNGSTDDGLVPIGVSGLSSGVSAVAVGGSHACALTTAGGLLCWGDDESGELGNNSYAESHVPVGVSGLSSGVAAISANAAQTCALTTAGVVLCWGGTGDGGPSNNVPVAIAGLPSGIKAIAVGDAHACALSTAGLVYCWGSNYRGELGNNSTTDSATAVKVVEP